MKKFTLAFLICTLLGVGQISFSQVSISTDGSQPHASAMLDVKSSDKGLLIPRLTTAEIEAIYLPADGLQVYNTDEGKLYIFVLGEYEWKEVSYATGNIQPNATYTIGTGGSCDNTVVHGVYYVSVLLKPYNYVTIEVNVSTLGQYTIMTDTINGYSFYGSGIFTSTGPQNIDLAANDIPAAAQTDTFTATAINGTGTCSFQVSPVVSPTFLCGMQFQDPRDGQMYNTVEIGTQCWMAENMNIGTMINSFTGGTNGNGEQTDNGTIEKWCYDNNASNCDTYGGLYHWNEAMQYATSPASQGICSSEWHIPTDNEWKTLEMELGMSQNDANSSGWRGTDEGGKLKETGTTHWWSPNTGATNSSGFTTLPGGGGNVNGFTTIGQEAKYWVSEYPNFRSLKYDNSMINRSHTSISGGQARSVRCIKN